MHRARRAAPPTAGASLVLALALYVALNGIGAPWWTTADPDGSYVGSGLNIMVGNHTNYLDHPGLPTQDALALAFGAQYLLEKGTYGSGRAYIDDKMLHLDGTRSIYRTWAVLVFAVGALLVFWLSTRFFGHWTWGAAAGVLFVASPGFFALGPKLRPDVGLTAACFAVAYLLATAIDRRSPERFAAAAGALGFALAFKVSAVGMLPALALAAVLAAPPAGWERRLLDAARDGLRRRWRWLAPPAVVWLALCVLFVRERLPLIRYADERRLLVNGGTILGGYLLLAAVTRRLRIPWADRIFHLFYGALGVALVLGYLLPASLILDDGIHAAVAIWQTLEGKGANANIEPFSQFSAKVFLDWPIPQITIVFALAAVGAAIGIRRRRRWPLLLTLAAFTLTALAAARLSTDYYYAPGFAVAILPAFSLFAPGRSLQTPLLLWIAVALAAVPVLRHRVSSEAGLERFDAAAHDLAGKLLRPGEVILAPASAPIADVRFDSFVRAYVEHAPDYPYRIIAANDYDVAERLGLRPRFYVDGSAALAGIPTGATTETTLGGRGPFIVRRLSITWGPGRGFGVLEVLKTPPA